MKKFVLLFVLSMLVAGTMFSQTNWTKYVFNPVMSPGLPGTFSEMGFPFIYVMHENDTMHMWYSSSDQYHNRIGYAWSTDGININFTDAPLFEQSGVPGTFDEQGVSGASVLHVNDLWYMWYNGNNVQPYLDGNIQTGLATSTDGKNWTRHSDQPVFAIGTTGSWDDRWAYCNTVLYEDTIFKMWYSGHNENKQNVGYATSYDGITWTKYAGNPILKPTISNFLHNARVIRYNGKYHMWFNAWVGSKERLYYTTSDDGIVWSTDYIEALPLGDPGAFDADWVWHPSVLIDDSGLLKMWYTGANQDLFSIGYATDTTVVSVKNMIPEATGITLKPSPASETTELHFTLHQQVNAFISLYNMMGEVVWHQSAGVLMPGSHSQNIDLSGFKSGMYTLVLTTNSGTHSAKLVILH